MLALADRLLRGYTRALDIRGVEGPRNAVATGLILSYLQEHQS